MAKESFLYEVGFGILGGGDIGRLEEIHSSVGLKVVLKDSVEGLVLVVSLKGNECSKKKKKKNITREV